MKIREQRLTQTVASQEEVIGVIATMNPYIGFKRTLNALRIANEVFNERKK